MSEETLSTSEVLIGGGNLGSELVGMLMAGDIVPGAEPSYQLCKSIFLYHPLGQKMAESPVTMAQSQPRDITIQGAPDEVVQAFKSEWDRRGADLFIHDVKRLSRIYGIAALVLGCKQVPSNETLDMDKIWQQDIYFNALDPLNVAGSLVLSQVPTDPNFNKPVTVRTGGETFHPSRFQVVMHERPIYLAYTGSAFGFTGRSVYQRALYPLKSFVRSMIADDMIQTKLGVIIAKQKSPGSMVNAAMQKLAAWKRRILKQAQTNNVISIDVAEDVQTLDMQNVDGAGRYSRDNILKNVATAADMPAALLNNETMVSGFGEGAEDAKNIAKWIDGIRAEMAPIYKWMDNIVQYCAWNPSFFERMQRLYPEKYGRMEYREAFLTWRKNFAAEWPSLLIEPDSEKIKVQDVILQAVIAMVQSLIGQLDPTNKMLLMQWAAENISENKLLFPHELALDWDALSDYQEEQAVQQQEAARAALAAGKPAGAAEGGEGKEPQDVAGKVGRFDTSDDASRRVVQMAIARLQRAISSLPPSRREKLMRQTRAMADAA